MSSKKEDIPEGRIRRLEDLILTLRCHMPEIASRYDVMSMEIFGSYVRGEQDEESDLDVLVEYEKVPGLFKYIELENHLEELLGINVYLVMKRSLLPQIEKRVLAEAVPV
ncbi:MAG: nucleotidyltransferase family protein [Methanotrichaceae archaeon]|nr:nucleotidyltransferase family protein [Methanotrichaceae archaeon]